MDAKYYGLGLAVLSWAVGDSVSDIELPLATAPQHQAESAVAWWSNYRAALAEGRRRQSLVLIWFADAKRPDENELLERKLFVDKELREKLAACVCVKLPLDAAVALPSSGESPAADGPRQMVRLLEHEAFAEMRGQRGIALIDMRKPGGRHFQRVVSVFPFLQGAVTQRELAALLDLPEGSLTQRTLIWAVRTHGERPQSAWGESNPVLMASAERHAWHQARLGLQGHHHWDQRFQEIIAQLPAGLVPKEICAESWPGQSLVQAAQDCVNSWRQSPGHWNAVCTAHPLYGYDMQRGASGVWYAVGIFGIPQ